MQHLWALAKTRSLRTTDTQHIPSYKKVLSQRANKALIKQFFCSVVKCEAVHPASKAQHICSQRAQYSSFKFIHSSLVCTSGILILMFLRDFCHSRLSNMPTTSMSRGSKTGLRGPCTIGVCYMALMFSCCINTSIESLMVTGLRLNHSYE